MKSGFDYHQAIKRNGREKMQLYESLEKEDVPKQVNWSNYVSIINGLSQEKTETFLSLIIHHYAITTGKLPDTVPYSGKTIEGSRGILYTINNLPEKLQRILIAFLRKYQGVR